MRRNTNLIVLYAMSVIVVAFLAVSLGGRFYNMGNFQAMAGQLPEFGFLAIAMALSMLTGGIDLSIVASANLAGVVAAFLMQALYPVLPAAAVILIGIVMTLIITTLCGAFNGFLISKFSIPPILATLGTMIFYGGIGLAASGGASVPIPIRSFSNIGMGSVFGVPYVLMVLIAVIIVISFVLAKTELGYNMYLLGENKTALRFSGTSTNRVTVSAYTLVGILVGVSAVIMISRGNSAKMGFGDTYQLQAILVAVLGGFDPNGGRGKISGVVIGMTLLQFLQSAFTAFGFDPYSKKLIWGGLLLAVMIINFYLNRGTSGNGVFKKHKDSRKRAV